MGGLVHDQLLYSGVTQLSRSGNESVMQVAGANRRPLLTQPAMRVVLPRVSRRSLGRAMVWASLGKRPPLAPQVAFRQPLGWPARPPIAKAGQNVRHVGSSWEKKGLNSAEELGAPERRRGPR